MADKILLEVAGFSDSSCGPFPCDGDRTCELEKCAPSEKLAAAFEALKERLEHKYPGKIEYRLTNLDSGLPERLVKIVEENHPPVPMILINGKITPIGRISLPQIEAELIKYM